LRSLKQEGDRYLIKCVYRGLSIQLCFAAAGGYKVQVCSDEEILRDWVFGKDIQAQEKAIQWFRQLDCQFALDVSSL
jgi:NOL1/NOP2/fmu family ribosome biogenesis protein